MTVTDNINISAGFNACQVGPWPVADDATRQEARSLLKDAKKTCCR